MNCNTNDGCSKNICRRCIHFSFVISLVKYMLGLELNNKIKPWFK